MKHFSILLRSTLLLALLVAALAPAIQPLHAQDATPLAADEGAAQPAPTTLTLDADGVAQATGSLEPQGMMSYVLEIDEGASVQALITSDNDAFVLTIVGADGAPLQTDHAGASNFDQTAPVSQEYTFKVINFGDVAQSYEFAVSVTPSATLADDEDAKDAADDAGVVLPLHGVVVVPLTSNPTTGYAWQVALSAEDVLALRGDSNFIAGDAGLTGAPGVEVFAFDTVGVGEVVVTFSYRQPWDEQTPPEQVIALPFVVKRDDAIVAMDATPAVAGAATITESDDGATVQIVAGGQLDVELPGNPTTGSIWQVTANDESILLPTRYTFTPDTDAAGAGGVEKFSFHVLAPGAVALELVNSRPWEADAPPEQSFTVTIDAVADWRADNAMITAGNSDDGATVTILPGNVLLLALTGAAGGAWQLVQGDAMVVQPLGDWQQTPDADDAAQAIFQRGFLAVAPGTVDLKFAFVNADGSAAAESFALTVDAPALEPGGSGAVNVHQDDAGGEFALVMGDTLVVRLAANPTTGYNWRVVSTNDTLLPAAGDPVYAVSSDLTGAGGVATFRFLAKAAGEATVQIGEFAPGADHSDTTLDFNVTIVEPAPLTGDTVTATAEDTGKTIDVAAGDWLAVELESNPSTGYLWLVTANDGAVLRLLPEGGFAATGDAPGAGGTQRFVFRALAPGEVELGISLFPPGEALPEQIFDLVVTVQ